MNKYLVMFAVLFVSVSAMAQIPVVENHKVSGSFETGVYSKYLDLRSGQVYTDNPVIQSDLTVSFPWFNLGIWNNSSLERGAGKTDGDEVDYTVSRSDTIGKVSFEYGVSYYDFAKLFYGDEGNSVALFCEVSTKYLSEEINIPGCPFENYIRVERVGMMESEYKGGTYFTLGSRAVIEKSNLFKILLDASFTRDNSVYNTNPDWIFAYKLSLQTEACGWTVSPQLILSTPFKGGSEAVFGLSAGIEF